MITKKKSKYYTNCIDNAFDNDNDNNNENDSDNNVSPPSSSPLPLLLSSPPQTNRMSLRDGNIYKVQSDDYSLLDKTEPSIHFVLINN